MARRGKGSRRRSPSKSRYHRRSVKANHPDSNYTQASSVTIRKADTGEVIGQKPPLDPAEHNRIVARGNRNARPSSRATKRRKHT